MSKYEILSFLSHLKKSILYGIILDYTIEKPDKTSTVVFMNI